MSLILTLPAYREMEIFLEKGGQIPAITLTAYAGEYYQTSGACSWL